MDELLHERLEQLKEIDERLERMLTTPNGLWGIKITNLRNDLALMIRKAQEEYAAF